EASWRLAPRPEDGARETLREIMAGAPAIYLALTDPASREIVAVGRAALVPHRRRTIAVLDQIAVDPGRRREGLGRAVVRSLLSLAAEEEHTSELQSRENLVC